MLDHDNINAHSKTLAHTMAMLWTLISRGRWRRSSHKLLIYAGSPASAPLHDLVQEISDITSGTYACLPAVIKHNATAGQLAHDLQHVRPSVFAFLGHGDVSHLNREAPTLGFVNAFGRLDLVERDALIHLLGLHSAARGGSLLLVVLNGCSTLEIGKAVRAVGVPFAICWATIVDSRVARQFSKVLFEALASLLLETSSFAEAVSRAFEMAKAEIYLMTKKVVSKSGETLNVPLVAPPNRPPSPTSLAPPPVASLPVLLCADDTGGTRGYAEATEYKTEAERD